MNSEFDRYKKIIENHLLDFLPEIDHKSITVYEAMKYSLAAGGKRLRPVLLLAACEFAGGDIRSALPYAAAIEYIHTYSLIHDDLPAMDDDDLRRGMPTNHKVYGEAMAILAGDGLLSTAFEIMNKDMLLSFDNESMLKRKVKAAYELSKYSGCRGMVAGQVADIEAENKQCSKEMLDYIHINKTAAIIIGSVRAGAHLGGADNEMLEALTSYAENLGLAFQIVDDILDVVGDEKQLGKKTGMDAENNKSTYPALYGIDASRERLDELTEKAIASVSKYGEASEFFLDLVRQLAVRIS